MALENLCKLPKMDKILDNLCRAESQSRMTLLPIMPGAGESRKERIAFSVSGATAVLPPFYALEEDQTSQGVPGENVSPGKKRLMITLWLDRKTLCRCAPNAQNLNDASQLKGQCRYD